MSQIKRIAVCTISMHDVLKSGDLTISTNQNASHIAEKNNHLMPDLQKRYDEHHKTASYTAWSGMTTRTNSPTPEAQG